MAEDDLEVITADILKKGADVGWYHNYRFRVSETDSGYLLIGLEATSTRSSMLYVLFVTLAVGIVSFILIFFQSIQSTEVNGFDIQVFRNAKD